MIIGRLLSLISSRNLIHIFFLDVFSAALYRPGFLRLILGDCCSHILGNVHQNRAWTSFFCNVERSADGACQLCNIFYNKVMLGDGHGNTVFNF